MRKDSWGIYGLGAVLAVAGFVIAYQFVEPAPSKHLRIATGGTSGAYYAFAQKYAAKLAAQGITLDVVSTGGSIDNLNRLKDAAAGVDVAFVQGGTGASVAPDGLMALGSVYYEPFWVFTRAPFMPDALRALKGKRIAVGGEGSGTRAVALHLLAENGIGPTDADLSPLGGREAEAALKAGALDAMMTVASPTSALVADLLAAPGVVPMNFARAEAYALRNRSLSALRLPRGAVDLGRDVPSADLAVLAPAATLVARTDLHPSFVTLLLQVARDVHGAGGLFEAPGAFPSDRFVEFPLSPEAERFYRSGPPFLQRYLPFWAADLIDRLKVMLIPLLTLLLPLGKVLPPLYRWRIRSRIYRWYKDLLEIEEAAYGRADPARRIELKARLDAIEAEVQHMSVPLSYADAAYSLRMHIGLVRETLSRAR